MPNGLKTALLLGALSGLLLLIGEALGGAQGLMFGFVIAAVMNLGSYWFSDKIVLKMYGAKEVDAGHPLYRITANLAQRGGLPMPRVYVIPQDSPNAFATGRNPNHAAVAATEGIMRILDEHELEGVIAHELAHVKHRDILISSIAATIAAAIMMVSRFAMFFGGSRDSDNRGAQPDRTDRHDHPRAACRDADSGGDLAVARVCGRRRWRRDRRLTERSDECAAERSMRRRAPIPLDANPATAHMFIIKPFSGAGLLSLFSTHPPTEQRIQALMQLPRL